MYNILANRKRNYGIKTYMVNTLADIDAIPLSLASVVPGSIAIVAETGDKYILNQNRQWALLSSPGGPGEGDSGEIKAEINYEGGDLNESPDVGDDSDINYDSGEL